MVTQVIVVGNDDTSDSNGTETESIGVAFCQKLLGADTNWKQTSYNGNMRGNYAGIGYTYMRMLLLWVLVLLTSLSISNHMLLGRLAHQQQSGHHHHGAAPALTDDQIAAGSYYTWDESAYQADTSDPKTAWVLTHHSE